MRQASLLLSACLCTVCWAQDPVGASPTKPEEPSNNHVIQAVKMAVPPTIDGVINDDEWKGIPCMTGMVDTTTGAPAPENAIFWLGYDDKYIYFASRLHDSQPGAIKQTEYRTNVSLTGDDYVDVDIDPYGALSDWSTFAINPKGATSITIAGGRAAKREWMGDFVAKARVTADGWEAEARIPWALMKLPGSGKREVRFDFDRFLARTGRYYGFTNVVGGNLNGVGRWQGVELPKIQEDKILQLLPYTYQGADNKGLVANGGLDLKMPLTDQINLVGTVNPDFRNIENQILSIDFSRFARLAAEARPFFQEGQQYYGSGLIKSQRIQSFDTGVNLYGKINSKLAMGMLNTTNFGNEDDFGTTWQYSPKSGSTLRFSHASVSSQTVQNRGYMFVYQGQINPSMILFTRGMSTKDSTAGNGEERTTSLIYQKKESTLNLTYQQISPNFLPRLGFFPETKFKGPFFNYTLDHPVKSGPVSDMTINAYGVNYKFFNGGDYRRETGGDASLQLRGGLQLSGGVDYNQFEGSDDHTYNFGVTSPFNDPYRNVSANYTWGEIDGSQYRNISFGSSYRPYNKLQLGLSAQFVHLVTDQKQLILSGNYDLGNDRAISGRVVQSDNDINAYVALQKSGNAGVEYFLILGDPNASRFKSSLILKVTFPLQMFLGHRGK